MLIFRCIAAGLTLVTAGMGVAHAQEFPVKPIRIVTTGIGGGGDFVARLVGGGMSGPLGQPVIIDNRASGVIPGDIVAKAPPDGHTLLVGSNSLWIGPFFEKTPYDPLRDLAPISLTSSAPNILVVHPSLPVKSVRDLVALAKARPGELNYASSASGGSAHLAGELFKYLAKVDIVRIPYKGTTAATIDLTGGHVQLMFSTAATVAPLIKAGRLRALAISTAKPSAVFPGVPTVASAGVPGYETAQFTGIFATGRTPPAVINRLNQEVLRALASAEVKAKFLGAGVEPVGTTPQQLTDIMKSEVARIGRMIKESGMRAE